MPTVTPLDPSDTLTPEPSTPCIQVRDLIEMLQREDPCAWVQVVTRASLGPPTPLGRREQDVICEALVERFPQQDYPMLDIASLDVLEALKASGIVRNDGDMDPDSVEQRHVEGLERRWYGGRKVVVVR